MHFLGALKVLQALCTSGRTQSVTSSMYFWERSKCYELYALPGCAQSVTSSIHFLGALKVLRALCTSWAHSKCYELYTLLGALKVLRALCTSWVRSKCYKLYTFPPLQVTFDLIGLESSSGLGALKVLRALRTLRTLRTVSFVKGLQVSDARICSNKHHLLPHPTV